MAGRIVQLPDAVANQIAAGEVVERPVAVVKELVENAIDAQARSIEIHFERGGKALIRVLDDGVGMDREDALMALRRHATSKIRKVEDILEIGSFGFRGEALPSIASVARFTLKTRPREAAGGTEVRVQGGAPEVRDCGMSPGTEVEVANLFFNVPARRKFLKTERTESAHILQMCRLLAVAHPEIGFSLIEDSHEVFRTPPCPDRAQRVRELFGRRRAEDLIPIDCTHEGIAVSGLIGRPGSGRGTRAEMITYVNRRPVDSRLLSYALIESYHRYLARGRYPAAFLFVEAPPREVDVNVHPTKREVRFRNEPRIRGAVMTGVTERLADAARPALARAERVEPADPAPTAGGEPAVRPPRQPPPATAVAPDPPRERTPFPEIREKPFRPVIEPAGPAPAGSGRAFPWSFRGAVRQHVGLFESADGLILLNAAAARERVLFERIRASLAGQQIPRQPLLILPMIELAPLDAGVLGDQVGFFDALGFEIEPFGRHLFRVRSVPVWLQSAHPEGFIEELVGRIRERGIRPDDVESARTMVARLAARREARGFRPRQPGEWEALAQALLACENPLLDARGRPTFIEMRHPEIARKLMLDGGADDSEGFDGGR